MNDMCSLCYEKFSVPKSFRRHMIKIHQIFPEPQTYNEDANIYRCFDCSSSYRINQDLIYHLENIHDVAIEREVLTFQNYADFGNWKHRIEKTESCKYVPFGEGAKTDEEPGVTNYVCYPACNEEHLEDTTKKDHQDCLKLNGACISNIKTDEDPMGGIYVERVKTHYGHDSKVEIQELRKSRSNMLKNEANESEIMEEDNPEDYGFENKRNNYNLKEDIKVKFDAVLSSLDKFDNKKLQKINSVLHNICEELDLVTESTNNEVIGTIIISSNSNLDHSYI